MAEPLGRPKTLVRRHILEIKGDTREWLDEKFDRLLSIAGVHAIGQAAQGFLSNPANSIYILGLITAVSGAFVGKEGIESVINFFGSLQYLHEAETREEKKEAAHDLAETMRALIRFFSPLGPVTPLP